MPPTPPSETPPQHQEQHQRGASLGLLGSALGKSLQANQKNQQARQGVQPPPSPGSPPSPTAAVSAPGAVADEEVAGGGAGGDGEMAARLQAAKQVLMLAKARAAAGGAMTVDPLRIAASRQALAAAKLRLDALAEAYLRILTARLAVICLLPKKFD